MRRWADLTCCPISGPRGPQVRSVSKEEETDRKKRFSGEQSIGFLREVEAGVSVKNLCREQGLSDASFCTWRSALQLLAAAQVGR